MTNGRHDGNRASMLQWIFERGNDRILCQIDEGRSLIVSLISPGAARTVVERFDDTLQAFQRHAQVAMKLRDCGWTVASYGR